MIIKISYFSVLIMKLLHLLHCFRVMSNEAKTNRGTCDYCGKTMLKKTLTSHFKICSRNENSQKREKTFECRFEDCSKKFHTKAYLRVHELRYHNEKYRNTSCPFPKCTSKVRRDNLVFHLKMVHEGMDTVVECPKCQRKFKRSWLRHHLRGLCSENRVKNVKCTFEGCSAIFYNNVQRTVHVKSVHSPQKSCEFKNCSYRGKNLAGHVSRVHYSNKISCENCNLSIKKASLPSHRKRCRNRQETK